MLDKKYDHLKTEQNKYDIWKDILNQITKVVKSLMQ